MTKHSPSARLVGWDPAEPVGDDDDVWLGREPTGDRPAGAVVEEPLHHPGVFPTGDHHGDLSVGSLDGLNVLADGPSDVAIEALGDVQRYSQDVPNLTPLLGQLLRLLRIDPSVQCADVERLNRSGISDGFEDAAV